MNSGRYTYLFGPFRLDMSRRILYTGSIPAPIPQRPFQLLCALLQANGAVVSRDTLAEQIWGDEGVTDSNVNQHIYLLRALLGERKGQQSYIVTIPGKGYRFTGSVSVALEDEEQLIEDAVGFGERASKIGNEVFTLYCRGSYLLERRNAASFHAAVEAFQAALGLDPQYVPALIGLARSYMYLGTYWHVPPQRAFPPARAAIERALARDSRSSLAHAVLSGIQLFSDWDWTNAKRSIATGMKLNPQLSLVRNTAAWYYIACGDLDRAVLEARRALIVEPSSLSLQLLFARVLVHSRAYPQAIAQMTNILAIDPHYDVARRYRAQAYLLAREPQKAIDDLALLDGDASEDTAFRLPMLARAYAELGDARALDVYNILRTRSATEYVPHWNLALIEAAIERPEDAIQSLQSALREREPTLLFLRTTRWFEGIDRRAEFKKIIREVGPC